MKILVILLLLFMTGALAVLVAGVVVMAVGGETDRKYSNRLMVLRVTLQAMAVLLLGMLFVFGE